MFSLWLQGYDTHHTRWCIGVKDVDYSKQQVSYEYYSHHMLENELWSVPKRLSHSPLTLNDELSI